ncbi:hypothetical protein ACFQKB_46755, partial [Actinomadura yumaensis]
MDAAALFLTGAGTGLLAGGTSCAAVQLGMLTGSLAGTRDAPADAGRGAAAGRGADGAGGAG